MGCDIHAAIEYAENGFYNFFAGVGIELFGGIRIERNYSLFARLGYNRWGMYGEFSFPPRGLPPDVSQEVREIFFVPNNFYIPFVKIEPESVNEGQLKKILKEEYGNTALRHYEENSIAPVLAFTHSVRLDQLLDKGTNFARLENEAELRGISSQILLERVKFYRDDEITKLNKFFQDWQSKQFKRTDFIICADEVKLQSFLEFYGDWAFKEYEATGLIPDENWHTPSWLNFIELKKVLSEYYSDGSEFMEETYLERALWAMHGLAEKYGNENVRLVFWFDN